jgi:hypothetical protein
MRDLALGRLSPETFARAEAKRAVNKLRRAWRKNPWIEGRTIDLGAHERRFSIESGIARLPGRVAPAVLDWLRWKYRRLQIDRQRGEEWGRVLREDYPRRVQAAGSEQSSVTASTVDIDTRPIWTVDGTARATSKRRRADNTRAVPERRIRLLRERQMPEQIDQTAMSLMIVEHRETLGPLLDACRSEGEQHAIILALRDFLARPQDPKAMRRWQEAVTNLWDRTGRYSLP